MREEKQPPAAATSPRRRHDTHRLRLNVGHKSWTNNAMSKRSHRNRINITTSLRLKPSPGEATRTIPPESITSFSHFFDSTKDQLQCYSNACSKTVDELLCGRNCTLFCYGHTGSGKTHTLFGPPNSFHSNTLKYDATELFQNVKIPISWGAFPRIVLSILNKSKISGGITATAVEIYMYNCYDLMKDGQKIDVAGFGRNN